MKQLSDYGIALPIFQAPIGSASSPELVSAISEAGGLGMLAGTWRHTGDLRAGIREIRKRTARPFAINLGVHTDPVEKIDLCLAERVPLISLFWGDARKFFSRIKSSGSAVIATIGSAREAKLAAEAGADILIAQGWEAGGHVWGQTSTFALLPEVLEAAPSLPVVAAGGIGDARGAAAVLALGAAAARLGTRFLVAAESAAHPQYQQLVIAARAEDTFYTELFDIGWPNAPHRVLKNSTIRKWQAAAAPTSGMRPGEDEPIARAADGSSIPRYSSRLPVRGMTGEIEAMALYAGQSVAHCQRIQPAAEIIRELLSNHKLHV